MKRLFSLLLSIILLIITSAACIFASSESATAQLQEMYAQGELLMAQGDYAGAATQFETLGAYSDAYQMAMYCKGIMVAEDQGMFGVAVSTFQNLGDFKASKLLMNYYQGRSYQASADALIEGEEREDLVSAKNGYDEASKIYSGLALFKDCLTRMSACQNGTVKAQEKIHAYDYAAADKLEQDGKYEEAIEAFKTLGSYSDSADRIKGAQEKIYARDYAAADQLEQDGKYEEAIRAFEALGSYSDSAERAKGAQEKLYARDYAAADQLEQDGKYKEAVEAFRTLGNYSDSAERAARIAFGNVGCIVVFGSYEQDNNISNGVEPIEWIVLDVQDKKALLISRYALDTHAYHSSRKDVTWETSELKSWLNGSFISTAFSATEQSAILMTTVDNSDRQGNGKWNTNGGNDTNDKLFLLSYAEAGAYFSNDDDRMCAPTDYAIAQGAKLSDRYKTDGRATGLWWLRSPGLIQDFAASVDNDGSRHHNLVDNDGVCVRPAFWLNLESEIF